MFDCNKNLSSLTREELQLQSHRSTETLKAYNEEYWKRYNVNGGITFDRINKKMMVTEWKEDPNYPEGIVLKYFSCILFE